MDKTVLPVAQLVKWQLLHPTSRSVRGCGEMFLDWECHASAALQLP